MHWSDHASLDALRYLARRASALPLLLIVTYRDDAGEGHRGESVRKAAD